MRVSSTSNRSRAAAAALCAVLALGSGVTAQAADDASDSSASDYSFGGRFTGPSHWRFAGSPYTLHFHPSPEHRPVWAVGVEKQWDTTDWLAGASYFSNSFGQDSAYIYVGKRYPGLWGWTSNEYFAQWSAGMLWGYRGEYKNKVPFNYRGFSPGLLVSLGWQFTPKDALTIHALGDAGLMLQYSREFR